MELDSRFWWWFAPRYWFARKPRPLIILDDVQKLFRNESMKEVQSIILNSFLFPLRDKNRACVILITSDYSIEKDLKALSGMTSRLMTFNFPKISKTDFENYAVENLDILRKKNNFLTIGILKKYHEDFNSDLRKLVEFIKKFEGNYESNYKFLLFFLFSP